MRNPAERRLRLPGVVLVGALTSIHCGTAELPPDIQADRLLVRADRQLRDGEDAAAVATLDRIVALQRDHGLEIPQAFWFKHAQASLDAGLFDRAIRSATEYLRQAGREGEHYLEALRILDAAELAAPEAAAAVLGMELATEPGRTFREALVLGGEGPEMVVIPAGRFRMGCLVDDGFCDSRASPVRDVTIAVPFALSVHELTFEDYDRSTYPNKVHDSGWGRGRRPVINVSWDDAQEYVAWLSAQTGAEYRLPTEAEWEYAARGGTTTNYSWGNVIGVNRANCDGCGSQWDDSQPAPVGSFAPNRFGLYDMHGNVWEWLEDCESESYVRAPSDGSAWLRGDCSKRVFRGGSWNDPPDALRAEVRIMYSTGLRATSVGFRVARTLGP